jgi:hypothetical protein
MSVATESSMECQLIATFAVLLAADRLVVVDPLAAPVSRRAE